MKRLKMAKAALPARAARTETPGGRAALQGSLPRKADGSSRADAAASGGGEIDAWRATALRVARRALDAYARISRRGPQQIVQPERLGEPAAAALLEEPLRVGAGDVAGHEHDATRQVAARRARSCR